MKFIRSLPGAVGTLNLIAQSYDNATQMFVHSSKWDGHERIIIAPGNEHPDNPPWVKVYSDGAGGLAAEARRFAVIFRDGRAMVPVAIGEYLIAKGLATRGDVLPRPEPMVLPSA